MFCVRFPGEEGERGAERQTDEFHVSKKSRNLLLSVVSFAAAVEDSAEQFNEMIKPTVELLVAKAVEQAVEETKQEQQLLQLHRRKQQLLRQQEQQLRRLEQQEAEKHLQEQQTAKRHMAR